MNLVTLLFQFPENINQDQGYMYPPPPPNWSPQHHTTTSSPLRHVKSVNPRSTDKNELLISSLACIHELLSKCKLKGKLLPKNTQKAKYYALLLSNHKRRFIHFRLAKMEITGNWFSQTKTIYFSPKQQQTVSFYWAFASFNVFYN